MKAKYQHGVFKPLEEIKDIKEGEEVDIYEEGEEVDIYVERHEWNKLAMKNPSFNFLKSEPYIYTKANMEIH